MVIKDKTKIACRTVWRWAILKPKLQGWNEKKS